MTNYTVTIMECEERIAHYKNEIAENMNDPYYFQETPIYDMHDTGRSHYECALGMIRYYEAEIRRAKEEAKREAEREAKLTLKAEKLGLTLNEYKVKLEEERKAKALKAKIKRYHKELEELNERKTYLEKWLKENEG